MADTDTDDQTHADTTQALIDAQQEARAALKAEDHRADLRKLADLTNEMLAMKATYDEVQARIDAREKVYSDREEALSAHLASKRGQNGGLRPIGEVAAGVVAEAQEAAPRRSERVFEGHAANCAVGFGEACDCQ
jgi:hypothetical protein